jgi:hypothetical protein
MGLDGFGSCPMEEFQDEQAGLTWFMISWGVGTLALLSYFVWLAARYYAQTRRGSTMLAANSQPDTIATSTTTLRLSTNPIEMKELPTTPLNGDQDRAPARHTSGALEI